MAVRATDEQFEQVPNEEHERRFLVNDVESLRLSDGDRIRQAYIWALGGYAARVRLTSPHRNGNAVPRAEFTLKGPRISSMRWEQEIDIPVAHAFEMFNMCNFRVSKIRYAFIPDDAWVVDVFDGENEGLVIAEFEGSAGAVKALEPPVWAGKEVTSDPRYDNENLAKRPWGRWSGHDRA